MNGWHSRLLVAAMFLCMAKLHDLVMFGCPNTPEWMLLYHASAGACDWLLLYWVQFLISGRLCDDIQASCLASIVVNFVGFCTYMAYAPPTVYNFLIMGLGYVQFLRLLFVGRYDADYHGRAMVPGAASVGA